MKSKSFLKAALVVMSVLLIMPSVASAEVVGRLTQVEGRVDILRGGKLPAIHVKAGDSVEKGDVLRCKSLSKAQITFMDNSIVTLSPGSRLAIDDYQFEPAKKKRLALLDLFRGMAHVVVNRLYKVQEPDFIIKTRTAVTGVRGTDFGMRLAPNSTTVMNFEGVVRVASSYPELTAWEQRADKIAFGSTSGSGFFPPGSFVDLQSMQGTTVQGNLPPTLPFTITPQDQQQFMNQLAGGLLSRHRSGGAGNGGTGGSGGGMAGGGNGGTEGAGGGLTGGTGNGGAGGAGGGLTGGDGTGTMLGSDTGLGNSSLGLTSGTGNSAITLLNTVTVPPTVVATTTGGGSTPTPTPTPSGSTFSFTQQYYGSAWRIMSDSTSPKSQSNLQAYSLGQRTGVYDGYFSAVATGSGTASSASSPLVTNAVNGSLGSPVATATGTVTGTLGQTLTGTMTLSNTANTFSSTGTVSISPTGELTYNWTSTKSTTGTISSGTTTQTPGTYFTQSVQGNYTSTANLAGSQAVVSNSGTLGGTQTMSGNHTWVVGGFSVTNTSPNANQYGSESGTVNIDSQGVLGAADSSSGKQTGVMTGTVTTTNATSTDTNKIGGPVTATPGTTTTPQATLGEIIGANNHPQNTTLGAYVQTSDTLAKISTQTNQGSYTISPTSSTTGNLSSTGWGAANITSEGNPSVITNTVNTMTGTVTDPSGISSTPGVMTTNTAAVTCPCSTNQGPAQLVGTVDNHTVVSGTGTADVAAGTVSFEGNFVSPDSRGTVTNGTLAVTSGTSVTSRPAAAAGYPSVTLSPVSGNSQTATLSATVVNSGSPVAHTLSGTIVSTSNNPAALPSAGTAPSNINVQGVVNSSGAGAVTVTVSKMFPAKSPVSTYMGPANVDPTTHALSAPQVVGKNPANPGVNQVPATQTGHVGTN